MITYASATAIGPFSDSGGRPLTWVCHSEDGILCRATSLLSDMPVGTWSGEELAQPALLLSGAWTHPSTRSDKLGALIAFWALDYASQQRRT
jgi:hypothetical protein